MIVRAIMRMNMEIVIAVGVVALMAGIILINYAEYDEDDGRASMFRRISKIGSEICEGVMIAAIVVSGMRLLVELLRIL